MNREEREQYVNYRIETAKTTLKAAKVLAENGFWNSSVNRLYYSLVLRSNIFDYDQQTVEPLFPQVEEMINLIETEIVDF